MAKLDLQIDLDDSALDRKIDEMGKKMSEGMSDAFSKIKPPKIPTSKPPLDNNAVKTIQESISALDKLEDRAQASALRLAELKTSSSELASAKALLNFQLHSGEITASQYNTAMGAVEIQQRQVSLSLQELNREVKQNINLETAAAGSLQEARIKLTQMNAEIVKAGGAMDGSNKELDEMIAKQKELYTAVTAMENKLGNYTRNVGNYASGWSGMGNAINQITREMPAFTVSVQTGLLGISNNLPILFDEISKATAANRALTAEGKKGIPVWKQFGQNLLSAQSFLSLGITLMTMYGAKMWEWTKTAIKGTNALEELKKATKEINDARLDGAKSAQGEITSLNTLYRASQNQSLGYNERLKAVKKLQDQYPDYFKNIDAEIIMAGKASKAYDKLSKSILVTAQVRAYENKITEISGKMLENNDAILEKRNSVTEKDRAKMKFEDDLLKNGGMVTSASIRGSGTIAPRQALADAEEMEKANAKLGKQIERYQTEIDKLALSNGVGVLNGDYGTKGKPVKTSTKEVTEYKNLIQKLIDIDRDYSRQFLSTNEAEIQAVKDKFAEIRKEVEEYNAKNPKTIIDITKVNQIEQRAIKSVEYKQETSTLIDSLEAQKKLYDDYNAYVKEVGVKAANEQFSEQLKVIQGFRDKLEDEYIKTATLETNAALNGFKGTTVKLTQAEEERAKALQQMKENLKEGDQARAREEFAVALELSLSHNDRVVQLEEDRNRKIASLGKNATQEQIKEINKFYDEELSAMTSANIQKEVEWERVFNNLQFYSKKATDKVLDDIQTRLDAELAAGRLTKEEHRQLSSDVNNAKVNNNLDKSWIASKSALDSYRASLIKYGKESDQTKKAQSDMFVALARDLSAASSLIGDVSGLLGNLGVSDGLQETINKIGALTDGLGSLAAGIASGNPISIVSGSIKLLTAAVDLFNTKDKKIQKQIQRYQDQLDGLEKGFSRLDKQINDSVGESFYSSSEAAISNLKQQQRLMESMARAEEEKKKTDKQKVQEYKNGISQIDDEIKAIEKSMTEMRIQTTVKDLAQSVSDALVSAFESGADAIEATDKVFDNFIKNALANSLKLKYIEPVIKDMINNLDSYMKSNGNSLVGFDFEMYKNMINSAGQTISGVMDQAYAGLGLSKESVNASSNLVSGAISRSITEASDSEQLGIRGIKIKNI